MKRLIMKRKIKMLVINLILLMIMTVMSVWASADSGSSIYFSESSGFYENSFYLEIEGGEGCDLYYTLDGNRPDLTSQKYTQPILIEDASANDNVYAALYKEDVEKYGQEGMCYLNPQDPLDKCNVVRVASYNEQGILTAEAEEVYFVGFQEKSGYDDMIKVSLVTESDYLFDYVSGIYVTGKKYDEHTTDETIPYWMRPANYMERGIEWEKAALIDIFDKNGEKMFSADCGIRIHGGTTRANPQKSFSIYAREKYGGGAEVYSRFI